MIGSSGPLCHCRPSPDIRYVAIFRITASPNLPLTAFAKTERALKVGTAAQSANSLQLLERPLHGESRFVRQSV